MKTGPHTLDTHSTSDLQPSPSRVLKLHSSQTSPLKYLFLIRYAIDLLGMTTQLQGNLPHPHPHTVTEYSGPFPIYASACDKFHPTHFQMSPSKEYCFPLVSNFLKLEVFINNSPLNYSITDNTICTPLLDSVR